MISNFKGIFSYFIFASTFIFIMSLIFFFLTKKYKKGRVKLFALFLSLNNRSILIVATFILNFTLVSFFSVMSNMFNSYVIYLIIVNVIISLIVSLNLKIFIVNFVYTIISIFSLKIINLVYNYLTNIYYDRLTFILGIIFVLMIIVYELFITFRLTEIVLKNKNNLGGIRHGRKSK